MDVALSADMESGYGIAPEQIADRMTKTIAAGAVGINIEDTDHHQPKTLFGFELAVERIAAARAAADATGIPFVLNARTDAYWHNGTGGGEAVHDAPLNVMGGAKSACGGRPITHWNRQPMNCVIPARSALPRA